MATYAAAGLMNEFARRFIEQPEWEARDEPAEPARVCCGRNRCGSGAGGGVLLAACGKIDERSFLTECLPADHARQQDHNRGSALGDGTGCAHGAAHDSGGGTGSGLETD